MGRRDHPGRGGKRRTVVQLNDTGSSYLARYGYSRNEESNSRAESNNIATNPLANLVGQYSSSSEGEDESTPASSSKVKEAPPASSSTDLRTTAPNPALPSSIPLPPQAPAPESTPGSQQPAEGDKNIDYEVANFLAEIESLSTEVPDSASEVEPRHLAPTPPVVDREASPKPVKDEPSVNRDGRGLGYQPEAREGAEPPRKPAAAAASSKAYGSMFVKGEPEFTNKDATIIKNNSKTVIKADSERSREEEEEDIPDAPVSVWQQCLDENTQYYYYWNTDTNEVTWEIPPEYTQYLLLYKEYEEKMTRIPEERKQRKQQRDAEKAKAKSSSSKDKSSEDSKPGSSKEEPMVGPQLPPSRAAPHGTPMDVSPEAGARPPAASTSSDSQKEGGSSPGLSYGPALPPSSSSTASADAPSDSVQESELALQELERTFLESTKQKMKKHRQERSKADSSSAGTSTASPYRAEALASSDLVSQSSGVEGKSSSKPGEDEEDDDVDIDEEEIDRELELALERKKEVLRKMEEQEEPDKQGKHVVDYHHSQASGSGQSAADSLAISTSHPDLPAAEPALPSSHHNHKRPLVEADSASRDSLDAEAPAPKVPRLSLVAYDNYDDDEVSGNENESSEPAAETETKPDVSSSTSGVGEAAEKAEPTTEPQALVRELVDILYGKLEFLEVHKKSLSKMHRLLVELETRFTDWKGGYLDTDYFLGCLAEANGLLGQYEASVAPDGWSCHWDRDFRRYYYTNLATGASQWDYPSQEEPMEGAGDSVSSSTAEAAQGPGKSKTLSPKASTSSSSQESMGDSHATPVKPGKSDSVVPKETKPRSPLVSVYPGEPPPPGTVPAYAGLAPPPPPPPEPTPGDSDDYACDSNEDIDGVQMSPDLSPAEMESENEADSTQTTSEPQAGSAVIAKPPQLHLPTVSSTSTSTTSSTASTTPSFLPPGPAPADPDTTLPPLPEAVEAGQGDSHANLPSSSISSAAATNGAAEVEKKEKKRKRDKITSSNLSLKKKNVSHLVQKWNQVRQEVEKEEKVQEDRQRDIQLKLEEWRK